VDELVGALIRGVFWLVGQVLKFILELVVSEAVEKAVKAGWRRFAALLRIRRPARKTRLPGGVSLEKRP
jgi:hypothetical protein